MKTNQFYQTLSDSDDTEASFTSSESESEDDDQLNDNIATDNYYKTRDDAVKWKRNTFPARSTIWYKHCRCKYYWSNLASATKFRITS